MADKKVKQVEKKKRRPDTDHKKDWDKENMVFTAFKLFRETENGRNDQDMIDYLSACSNRSATIKAAIRDYMTTHPAE